jgi:hypothetical protein
MWHNVNSNRLRANLKHAKTIYPVIGKKTDNNMFNFCKTKLFVQKQKPKTEKKKKIQCFVNLF